VIVKYEFLRFLTMQKNLTTLGVIAILGASLAISGFAIQDAMAANSANKSSFDSDTMELIMANDLVDNDSGNGTLAYASMKASNPQDVLVLYDEECSVFTELNLKGKNAGDDGVETDQVRAAHKIDLIIEGNSTTGNVPITMCERTYGISTNALSQIEEICDVVTNIDDPATDGLTCDEVFFDTWINTKAAHGWHWVIVNLGEYEDEDGNGLIDFKVVGSVEVEDERDRDTTGVAVGQRSLTVIPIHLDVGA
jgi:hypothetical protein